MMDKTRPSIYVVDDDASVREAMESLIQSAGLRVETFASAQEFLASPRADGPSCLVLDVQLPGLSGLDLQQELAKADVRIPIIFLTGHGDIPTSVRAIKAGALEFLTKPFDDQDLLDAIQQGIAQDHRARQPRRDVAQRYRFGEIDQASMFKEIVGSSPALQRVLSKVTKVAPTDSTVLITGETGTGKELIARAIHKRSQRSERAFVKVNCAALPPSLIASELFGHEKGAFTGALQRRLGRFELAEGGSIFLDEIGELPPETQIALLRVLQEREFERVGGGQPIAADVRVIAATNRDLKAAVASGTFRTDLFYRFNVFPIEVPPLRERMEDIPLLVEYFIGRYASQAGKKIRNIEQRTLERFQSYHWPGNLRELQNVIERSVILCEGETLSVDEIWLSKESHQSQPASRLLADQLLEQEKEIIESALLASRGQVAGPSGAAVKVGLPPSTLEARIKALKIDKKRFNSG